MLVCSVARPMLDLDSNPALRRLFHVARLRVSLGFVVAVVAFWFAAPTWMSLTLGGVLAGAGEAIRVWAAGHLRKSQEVTTSGPYRLTRHPLYVGSFTLGLGFVVAAAHTMVALVVLGYLALMLWAAIRLEEATLREAFGSTYDRYAGGTLHVTTRRFSFAQVVKNGEHHALLGLVAALGVLAMKVLYLRLG